ncbi:MAG: DegT/DnrJ/EryC1/StrS family aminotransferase [Anaerolineaceae bacterium]|nr:DegT/DnrJ/EryC1/StrS family aminotransferase [Anaerolineaceae bacterium]
MDFYAAPKIPMSSPDIGDEEREAVLSVLNTKYLSMGPYIGQFEEAICKYTGAKHAIGVNSGTSGLHLCVRAAGIGPGDLVLTTPFSFVSSANVALFEQATPVFVDVEERTGNIDVEQLAEAAADLVAGGKRAQKWLPRKNTPENGKLKAIIPVDVFGQPPNMDPIIDLARKNDLTIIEDSCEALGGEYKGRKAGTLGDFGVFAFYPNKQITVGEGGMIVTENDAAADMMRSLRNQGRAVGDTWLQHKILGYNYRMDEMSAALGTVQMKRLSELLGNRARVAGWYEDGLAGLDAIDLPQLSPECTDVSWFVYVVRLHKEFNRDEVAAALNVYGVPIRSYFTPIHLQPYMTEMFGYQKGDYPITEMLGKQNMAIPFSGSMSHKQVDQVCSALRDVLG